MNNTGVQAREKPGTWLLWLCGLVIVLSLSSSFVRPIGVYDEGFSLTNAWRIMGGEIPHRDYWAAYPPGTSLTLAGAFYLFEPTLLVARVVNLGWSMLLLGAVFALLRQFASATISLLATVLAALWVCAALYPSYSVTPALALTFLTLACLFKGLSTGRSTWMLTAGVAGGFVLVFRHDFSAYLYFSLALSLGASLVWGRLHWQDSSFKWLLKQAAMFSAVALVCLAVLLGVCGTENFWQQAIAFPLTGLRAHRYLPFPGMLGLTWATKSMWLLAWFVPGYLLGVCGLLWAMPPRKDFPKALALVLLASMAILLTFQAHNRLDASHVAPSVLFALCFVVVSIGQWVPQTPSGGLARKGVLLVLGLYTLWGTLGQVKFGNVLKCATPSHASSCMSANAEQIQVLEYVNQHFARGDAVFVGNSRHDKIFINDASMYFLLKRPVAVKWNEMHPGVVTTEPVQKAMIQQIEQKRVGLVVLANMPDSNEANASAISSQVRVLDDYIQRNYHAVFANKQYTVLSRVSAF
jgi:hypothetical protein